MPEDEDKYPTESGRRRFVKGVVGSAALAGLGTGGAAAVGLATAPSGAGGGITQFMGIENTAGPAPRGMPIVPIEIDGEGAIKGVWPEVQEVTEGGRTIQVAETDIGGFTYSSAWFQYCGVQTFQGIQPGTDEDNFMRAGEGAPYDWQTEAKSAGDKLFVEDFADYEEWGNGIGASGRGKPAMASWRSQNEGADTIPVQVVRSPEVTKMANGEGKYSELPGPVQSFISEATADGFIAWLDKCTHFCCVPAYKAYEGSAKFGAENDVYCQCHQSVYDPFSPVQKSYVALPRPEE
jgi:Rieske Fe-S protein